MPLYFGFLLFTAFICYLFVCVRAQPKGSIGSPGARVYDLLWRRPWQALLRGYGVSVKRRELTEGLGSSFGLGSGLSPLWTC